MGLAAFIAARFGRCLNSPTRLTNSEGERLPPGEIGRLGEKMARVWLRRNGCKILYNNFRAPQGGEIDIVARDRKLLLFTEVKTRTSTDYGRPLNAVNHKKQQLIQRGANEWLRLLGTREIPWRFDVIEIILKEGELPSIHRVENAF